MSIILGSIILISGGRDQEDPWFKASLSKQSARPYLEKNHHKKGLVEWLKV
jgi:hypothetical protein